MPKFCPKRISPLTGTNLRPELFVIAHTADWECFHTTMLQDVIWNHDFPKTRWLISSTPKSQISPPLLCAFLYKSTCLSCHLPPVVALLFLTAFLLPPPPVLRFFCAASANSLTNCNYFFGVKNTRVQLICIDWSLNWELFVRFYKRKNTHQIANYYLNCTNTFKFASFWLLQILSD